MKKKTVKGTLTLLTAIILVGVLALTFTACGGDSDSQNVLIVTGIPSGVFNSAYSNGALGLYPPGTTVSDAIGWQGLVAGAFFDDYGVTFLQAGGNYNVTFPLYRPNSSPWSGSGTYDVYCIIGSSSYYRASSVNFSGSSTTVPWSSITQVYP